MGTMHGWKNKFRPVCSMAVSIPPGNLRGGTSPPHSPGPAQLHQALVSHTQQRGSPAFPPPLSLGRPLSPSTSPPTLRNQFNLTTSQFFHRRVITINYIKVTWHHFLHFFQPIKIPRRYTSNTSTGLGVRSPIFIFISHSPDKGILNTYDLQGTRVMKVNKHDSLGSLPSWGFGQVIWCL